MAQKTLKNLKTKNRDFHNVLDSFVNFSEKGDQGTSGDQIKLAGNLHVVQGSIVNKRSLLSKEGLTLQTSSSGAIVHMSGAAAATYVLPAVANSAGVTFDFIIGSAHAHILSASSGEAVLQGTVIDSADGTTVASDHHANANKILLANALLGDRISVIGDGVSYHFTAVLNDTPTVA